MRTLEQWTEICNLLHRLGVTENYTGFSHTAYAVRLCVNQPERLLLVTKLVYPEVAKRYQTNWKAVERNLRTVGRRIWERRRAQLEQLAGEALLRKPGTAYLLAILTREMQQYI